MSVRTRSDWLVHVIEVTGLTVVVNVLLWLDAWYTIGLLVVAGLAYRIIYDRWWLKEVRKDPRSREREPGPRDWLLVAVACALVLSVNQALLWLGAADRLSLVVLVALVTLVWLYFSGDPAARRIDSPRAKRE